MVISANKSCASGMTLRQAPQTCVVVVKFYWLRDSTQQLHLTRIVVPLCTESAESNTDGNEDHQAVAAENQASADAQRLKATVIQSCKEIYFDPPPFPKAEGKSAENLDCEDEYIGQRIDVWQNNGRNFWAGDTEHECMLPTDRYSPYQLVTDVCLQYSTTRAISTEHALIMSRHPVQSLPCTECNR
jgi:hypothetical protein